MSRTKLLIQHLQSRQRLSQTILKKMKMENLMKKIDNKNKLQAIAKMKVTMII